MRDLCARTGLSRQAIHFYVEQGLVDPPHKTGQTMGYYTEAHVERILLVRKLQDEHFLPLKAIRAMLAPSVEDDELSPAQREVLASVKARLSPATPTQTSEASVAVGPLLSRTGVTRGDLAELERLGLVSRVTKGRLTAEDAWVVELWGEVRAAGFVRELGFEPELLAIFARAIDQMFREEKKILARLAVTLPAARVAEMVDRALPLVHRFLVRAHEQKVRTLFASIGDAP
jgi:DNA-binding transcriptional MerR regulator